MVAFPVVYPVTSQKIKTAIMRALDPGSSESTAGTILSVIVWTAKSLTGKAIQFGLLGQEERAKLLN